MERVPSPPQATCNGCGATRAHAGGRGTLTGGRGTLTGGRGTLTGGRGTITEGRGTLTEGRGTLTEGHGTLTEGRGTLTGGRGRGTLTGGYSTLTGGYSTLTGGYGILTAEASPGGGDAATRKSGGDVCGDGGEDTAYGGAARAPKGDEGAVPSQGHVDRAAVGGCALGYTGGVAEIHVHTGSADRGAFGQVRSGGGGGGATVHTGGGAGIIV